MNTRISQSVPSSTVTLDDILSARGVSDKIVSLLPRYPKDKRNLRLVNKVARAAVDRTVTGARLFPFGPRITAETDRPHDIIEYLANSDWKGIVKLDAQPDFCGRILELNVYDINLLASAGFTALESLSFRSWQLDISCARNVVNAGWKLKELKIFVKGPSPEWLEYIVKNGTWQLEMLSIEWDGDGEYTSDILNVVSKSEWPIKSVKLESCKLDATGINMMLEASWGLNLEHLELAANHQDVSFNTLGLESCKALVELTRKAINLKSLSLAGSVASNECFLVLATGKYDNLLSLDLSGCTTNLDNHIIAFSSFLALLQACPRLEELKLDGNDPVDANLSNARVLASCLPAIKRLNLAKLNLTPLLYEELFKKANWPLLESLKLSSCNSDYDRQMLDGPTIAALAQRALPNLKHLELSGLQERELYREFSKQHWAGLETLQLTGDHFGQLELLPENLPRLKELKIYDT